jgi:acyl carrier protein
METTDILSRMEDIFRDILDNDTITLAETTTAADVEDWDSLNHIQLVVGIEKAFKIKFTTHEINSWNNVGDIAKSIKGKL